MNLVESYLRLNGYLTLSEFEIQARGADGSYETVTDVDIVGFRFPGDIYAADDHEDCRMLQIIDPALELRSDMVDVILGEVKQGDAQFNPGLKRHEVLHSVLQRLEWAYGAPIAGVVNDLQVRGFSETPACSGAGTVRTRLVAFGRSPTTDLHTISLSHIFQTMVDYFHEMEDVLRPAQFKDPAPALLRLLVKTGFEVTKPK
ncbi:MAG: hypothetical protein MUP13_05675 [Thermoanaerobaculales bacterium]|nr:hypothetical protein [Thermoanaerobaculales bacterium]